MTPTFDNVHSIDPGGELKGSDVFIVGGGASLKGFPFQRLTGRKVIGVNEAFRLGSKIVPIMIFGDSTWFQRRKWDLEKYTGKVVCVAPSLHGIKAPWICKLGRAKEGMGDDHHLPWQYSTGASAIALAVVLGAQRVFLLGFDMTRIGSITHWHKFHNRVTNDVAFRRHLQGMAELSKLIRSKYSTQIINISDVSCLDVFEKVSMSRLGEFLP